MDIAPAALTAPDGTVFEPVRVLVEGQGFHAYDKHGFIVAGDTVISFNYARRNSSIEGTAGRWNVNDLNTGCGCNARRRELRREWEEAQAAT